MPRAFYNVLDCEDCRQSDVPVASSTTVGVSEIGASTGSARAHKTHAHPCDETGDRVFVHTRFTHTRQPRNNVDACLFRVVGGAKNGRAGGSSRRGE